MSMKDLDLRLEAKLILSQSENVCPKLHSWEDNKGKTMFPLRKHLPFMEKMVFLIIA